MIERDESTTHYAFLLMMIRDLTSYSIQSAFVCFIV